MSSRYEKEKRLRPRNNPYKRDHFNQTEYLRITKNNNSNQNNKNILNEEQEMNEDEYYDEYYDDEWILITPWQSK